MEHSNPKVSIIIPVYNVEPFLRRCLDSIVMQIYRDFEVVLIDDGSEDQSKDICDEYVLQYPYMRVYHKENAGVVHARNVGIRNAKGKYIAFVDADDWVESDFLSVLVTYIDTSRADMVISGYWKEENGKKEKRINKLESGIYEKDKLVDFYKKMLYYEGFYEFGIQPFLWNKLFKKNTLLECINLEQGIYEGEDVAIIFPYMLAAKKINVIEECLYHYMIRSTSSSKDRKFNFLENTARLYLYLNKQFQKSQYYAILLPQLDAYLRMMVYFENKEKFIMAQENIFPFYSVQKDAKVILYGAGYVGKVYYNQLALSKYCQIVAWIDAAYRKDEYCRLGVKGPEYINEVKYDYIIIAIQDRDIANEVKKMLIQKNVLIERIIISGEYE